MRWGSSRRCLCRSTDAHLNQPHHLRRITRLLYRSRPLSYLNQTPISLITSGEANLRILGLHLYHMQISNLEAGVPLLIECSPIHGGISALLPNTCTEMEKASIHHIIYSNPKCIRTRSAHWSNKKVSYLQVVHSEWVRTILLPSFIGHNAPFASLLFQVLSKRSVFRQLASKIVKLLPVKLEAL